MSNIQHKMKICIMQREGGVSARYEIEPLPLSTISCMIQDEEAVVPVSSLSLFADTCDVPSRSTMLE